MKKFKFGDGLVESTPSLFRYTNPRGDQCAAAFMWTNESNIEQEPHHLLTYTGTVYNFLRESSIHTITIDEIQIDDLNSLFGGTNFNLRNQIFTFKVRVYD